MKLQQLFSLAIAGFVAIAARAMEEKFDARSATGLPAGWVAQAVEWKVANGALRGGSAGYSFAFPENISAGDEVVAEVTVRIEKRVAKGWALSGIAMRQDDQNYWHIALCEAPAENASRHFVELSEMLNGHWLAQFEPESKLTSTKSEGGNFAWEFNHDYRLNIAMRDGGIEGTVSETDGTVRAHLGFKFDRPAVTWGSPTLCSSAMASVFDDFKGETAKLHAVAKKTYPEFNASSGEKISGKATGFFHSQNIDGKDWLIDPLGHPFLWVGTDHVSYRGHWCEKLGYQPYGRATEKKYGSEAAWADATLARLKAWGFNTLPTGFSPSLEHRGLAHIKFLSMGTGFAHQESLVPTKNWTGFPDVFSPNWARYCDVIAAKECAPNRDDPWMIGYFIDNELQWFGSEWRGNGLFESAWKLPAEHNAKKAWIAFFADQKIAIAEFNRIFGTSFADFAALAADTKPREFKSSESVALAREWVRIVAENYFKTTTDAIRRHDANHMVLGCRFAGDAPDVLDIAGKYNDIVSLNTYPMIDVERGVPAKVLKMIQDFHEKCGKPMAITEWSFPAMDAGLPSIHGAGMRVDTQAQRAKCFTHFQDFLFRTPFIVGSSYFMYLDEPALGISSSFPEDSNYGLVKENDDIWPEITAAATAVNREVYRLHRQDNFRPAALPEPVKIPSWLHDTKSIAGDVQVNLSFASGRISFAFPGASPAWRVTLDGHAVAEIYPGVHKQSGDHNEWMHPKSARIIARGGNDRADSTDIEFTFDGARAAMRYWVPKNDSGWIASQGLWVENTSQQAWKLGNLFHFCSPLTDGDIAKIDSISPQTSYYRRDAAWVDRERQTITGCWVPESERLEAYFWKDAPAAFHSDAREKVEQDLKPGETWTASPTPFFFFVVKGGKPADCHAACDSIARDISK